MTESLRVTTHKLGTVILLKPKPDLSCDMLLTGLSKENMLGILAFMDDNNTTVNVPGLGKIVYRNQGPDKVVCKMSAEAFKRIQVLTNYREQRDKREDLDDFTDEKRTWVQWSLAEDSMVLWCPKNHASWAACVDEIYSNYGRERTVEACRQRHRHLMHNRDRREAVQAWEKTDKGETQPEEQAPRHEDKRQRTAPSTSTAQPTTIVDQAYAKCMETLKAPKDESQPKTVHEWIEKMRTESEMKR